ncbi:hypothetical protein T01_6512 [Trichinella spiralis]|uniref:Uncharacterized protein n=1 Tax=Trichinella spiralis TaxID=6334 RepID=A0A0V1B8W0_TRISP|nr:hypothetical protein T01_6512 [Trichinella spiralis]
MHIHESCFFLYLQDILFEKDRNYNETTLPKKNGFQRGDNDAQLNRVCRGCEVSRKGKLMLNMALRLKIAKSGSSTLRMRASQFSASIS